MNEELRNMKVTIYDKCGNEMDFELTSRELWVSVDTKTGGPYLINITAEEWKACRKFITFKNILKIWGVLK